MKERLIYPPVGVNLHDPVTGQVTPRTKLMLREAIQATGIAPTTAASLLGINPELFSEWLAEQRPLPSSVAALLSTVIGIDLSDTKLRKSASASNTADYTPAIWYRLKEASLVDTDREFVFLIRQLGYYIHELEAITGVRLVGWRTLFEAIRNGVDKQAPPRVQGRQAAAMFLENRGLNHGAEGIGEIIRGNLRAMGVVVIETPIRESKLQGCCFFVGTQDSSRPCVFANSYRSTWFFRNMVLMHEVAHAIFDAETDGATLDFKEAAESHAISEERADAFALATMVPARVLRHVAHQNQIRWDAFSAGDLAKLVAAIHVDRRALLRAAVGEQLITTEQYEQYKDADIADDVRALSDHALSTREYISKRVGDGHLLDWVGKQTTTIPSTRLRLPALYVAKVLEAFKARSISNGKAAEMLMIDESTFAQRFGSLDQQLVDDSDW